MVSTPSRMVVSTPTRTMPFDGLQLVTAVRASHRRGRSGVSSGVGENDNNDGSDGCSTLSNGGGSGGGGEGDAVSHTGYMTPTRGSRHDKKEGQEDKPGLFGRHGMLAVPNVKSLLFLTCITAVRLVV